MRAIQKKDLFQAIAIESFIKVDFHVGGEIPNEVDRSLDKEIIKGLVVKVPSLEDAIASKLYWIKLGSGKSREDVIAMLNGQHKADMEILTQLCKQMGLQDLLAEMKAEAAKE